MIKKSDSMEKTIEAIDTGINNELNGLKNYLKFARETQNFSGKNMFIVLATDELDHFKLLSMLREKIAGGKNVSSVRVNPSLVQRLFPDFSKAPQRQVSAGSDMDALNVALKFEENSRDYYANCANETSEKGVKEIFLKLSEIEDSHFKIIKAEIDNINKSGFWMDLPEFSVELPE